jgi:hypothetical protein
MTLNLGVLSSHHKEDGPLLPRFAMLLNESMDSKSPSSFISNALKLVPFRSSGDSTSANFLTSAVFVSELPGKEDSHNYH